MGIIVLCVVMLSVVILSVVMLSVVLLSDVWVELEISSTKRWEQVGAD